VVPFCQGEIFARALQDKGVKHEFYPVEGGGHGFNMYTEENLTRMVTFLNNAREAQK
jgi:acetyl esterase/lipase